jgi:glycosyltransferase involved in cell wall biosynthesis
LSKVVKIKDVKIGIFDPYLDTLGGGEKYMLTAAECLSKNHEVFLFWDTNVSQDADKRFGIDISKIKITKNIFSLKVPLLERILESMKYDRIFYLSDGSIPIVFPKKLFLHFQFPVDWVNAKSIPNKLKIQHINKIICNSNFTKSYIDKSFGIESIVIYPPSSGEFNIQNTKKENIILSVGRLSFLADGTTFKKQEFMIETFKKLVDNGLKNWKLILVISFRKDQEKDLKKIKDLINKYPVIIEENVENKKLTELYSKSKIYWHAAGFGEDIKNHPEMAEHFGIATVQAMEQGSVPVVINSGGQKEIVMDGDNGFLWNDQNDLVEKTLKVIKSETLMNEISKKAQKRAKDFSKNMFCKKVSEIFQ